MYCSSTITQPGPVLSTFSCHQTMHLDMPISDLWWKLPVASQYWGCKDCFRAPHYTTIYHCPHFSVGHWISTAISVSALWQQPHLIATPSAFLGFPLPAGRLPFWAWLREMNRVHGQALCSHHSGNPVTLRRWLQVVAVWLCSPPSLHVFIYYLCIYLLIYFACLLCVSATWPSLLAGVGWWQCGSARVARVSPFPFSSSLRSFSSGEQHLAVRERGWPLKNITYNDIPSRYCV